MTLAPYDSAAVASLDEWRASMARFAADGNLEAIKNASDVAEIYRQHAKNEEQQRLGGAAKLECAYYGGEVLATDADLSKGKSERLSHFFPDMPDDGRRWLSSRWQRVYRQGRERLDAYIESAEETPTYSGFLTESHVSHNTGENEWYTPPQYIEAARRVMGDIDLDPASSDRAQELVQATVYFTKDDDGLTRPWAGRVWMNPPYSKDLIWPFCERLCEFYASGDVTEAVVLVNNATETAAFQRMAELASAMCFHAKRIKYLNRDLEPAETPVQGQAFIYFGENVDAFRSEFLQFGFTVTP